jgi:hypothetical protein
VLYIASVRRNKLLKKVTGAEVEAVVKLWLRYAIDRGGGRGARADRHRRNPVDIEHTDASD